MNYDILKNCRLCPRNCGVNRQSGKIGFCGSNSRIKIARAALHFWEEPCISGKSGSGAIFFSHCTLKCVFCQNYGISTQNHGKYISESDLSDIFLHLQDQGANNINLVTLFSVSFSANVTQMRLHKWRIKCCPYYSCMYFSWFYIN